MQRDLTKGNILPGMMLFSLPYLFSYFLQTLYGMADLFITGRYNGAAVLSAVSIGSQAMHMITVIIVGLAMGATVMVGRAVGAKDSKKAATTIGNTITLFLTVSLVLTIVLVLFVDGIVALIMTPQEAVLGTKKYLLVCFLGIPFITTYNIISSILRGLGDSKSPMIFITIACVTNIILDYVLIGGFGMQSIGAAIGTVLSQTLSVILAIFWLVRKNTLDVTIRLSDLKPDKAVMTSILKVGVPVALQDGFIQVSFMLITIIANKRGVDVAAAVGVVEKIISFLFLVPSTVLSTVSAMAAQNIGANKPDRAKRVLWYGVTMAVLIGAFFAITCQFVAIPIISMFSDEANVVTFGVQYLRTYVLDCVVAGIHFGFSGYFCASDLSLVSFVHNVVSILLIRVPGAYFASVWYPDNLAPMGLAAPLGSLLSAIICIMAYYIFCIKKIKRNT